MPKTTAKKTKITRTAPKSGKKHSQQFLKVYWPYLPLFILVFFGFSLGVGLPGRPAPLSRSSVLAYATEMSASQLLAATNAARAANGNIAPLTYNSKLANAAQAKANDMKARDYWSHNTPDGQEPWVFFDQAGYDYMKAGENLAYGFGTSDETVNGWMNSPSHRANMLDSSFKEVGFGFVNASNFVGNGEETIVVAEYGTPAAVVSVSVAPQTAATPAPNQVKASSAQQPTASTPVANKEDTVVPATTPSNQNKDTVKQSQYNQAVNSDSPVPASQPAVRITRLQTLTKGYAPWSAAALSTVVLIVTILWALKHAIIVKRVVMDGEKFLLHHPLIDVGVMALVAIAILLSQSSGVVK